MRHFPKLIALAAAMMTMAAHAAPEGRDKPMRHAAMHERADRGPLGDLGKMRAELKLNAEQEAKWAEAEAAAKAAHEQRRGQHERMRAVMEAERKRDVLDLAKLDREMRTLHEEARAQHEASRTKWLAAYESLNADQKRMVSDRIKARMSHRAERAEKVKARREQMRERMSERMKERGQHAPKPADSTKG